jgi:glutaminyl-peptide cyclotransferase
MQKNRISSRAVAHLSLGALLLPALLIGGAACSDSGANAQGNGNGSSPTTQASASPAAASAPSTFDAKRAFSDLEKQVSFGPRVPGTPTYTKARDWILAELKTAAGDSAARQDFTTTLPGGGPTLAMSNIIARFNPEAKTQVMLCAHWDSRPSADQEIDASKRKKPIPGANDGASGVAVLLELARMFKANPPSVGVQLVLFDGEDYGPHSERMYLGAKHYARKPAYPMPTYAILIDMIGDKDLQIYREKNSELVAPKINDKVWKAASALGIKQFQYGVRHEIQDDHLPLQEAGIDAIDLIDFDYGPWHTLDDTTDKCSPESLKAVGDVLAKVVYDEK